MFFILAHQKMLLWQLEASLHTIYIHASSWNREPNVTTSCDAVKKEIASTTLPKKEKDQNTMPSSVSLESKLGPATALDFDSGFNDQDSERSSQQSADSVLSNSQNNSRGSSLEKSSATNTQWAIFTDFWSHNFGLEDYSTWNIQLQSRKVLQPNFDP